VSSQFIAVVVAAAVVVVVVGGSGGGGGFDFGFLKYYHLSVNIVFIGC